jgi:hypothetical protein
MTTLAQAQAILEKYLAAEADILLGKEVRLGSSGGGADRLWRSEDLAELRKGRQEWERRVAGLQAQAGGVVHGSGQRRRHAVQAALAGLLGAEGAQRVDALDQGDGDRRRLLCRRIRSSLRQQQFRGRGYLAMKALFWQRLRRRLPTSHLLPMNSSQRRVLQRYWLLRCGRGYFVRHQFSLCS